MELMAGTPIYTAPEISKGVPFSEKCDIWSLGIIIYMLLTKKPLFFTPSSDTDIPGNEESVPSLKEESIYKFPLARDFLKNLLQKNPLKRFSAKQALNHNWLRKNSNEKHEETANKCDNIVKNFENSKQLKNLFFSICEEGKGSIMFSDLLNLANKNSKTPTTIDMQINDKCPTFSGFIEFAVQNKLHTKSEEVMKILRNYSHNDAESPIVIQIVKNNSSN